jgi:hypothetical protein
MLLANNAVGGRASSACGCLLSPAGLPPSTPARCQIAYYSCRIYLILQIESRFADAVRLSPVSNTQLTLPTN